MLFHCGLLLMFLSCVRTMEYSYDHRIKNAFTEFKESVSLWPGREKRQSSPNAVGLNEGGGAVLMNEQSNPVINPSELKNKGDGAPATAPPSSQQLQPQLQPHSHPQQQEQLPSTEIKYPNKVEPTMPIEAVNHTAPENSTNTNGTLTKSLPKHLNLQDSRVIMRGIIVFGGFMLIAVAYYLFYRKNSTKNDTGSTHNTNDANQFRYGVLKSEDRRDNMELSVPLTFESDDDDDEDLEIFDLGQKKKSLSYVNLQTNDEELVFPTRDNNDTDNENLLLDIDDTGPETLINWSSNSNNKSIL